ncbi:quercetin 2,3-dioxygenase [Pleomorphomonas diazotrophica]|uniref:Quercetin 2,3-dioxygenase n=1 Tax=Pleomorphomonas diazotrophica TaxID=1166257 RepID=A0A1I4RNH6_9HYPH|nr:pirin family protein [Pleomorphomonas diazotrophica]PKR88158.1 quercetin 2,3-dioxygenase [Pleomorphomonas diazotrophica]SFM53782.1 hypothetical protein SAMN05192571_102128 [Pleomorphomonas diazotrophica]
MITIRKASERGHTDAGWLDSHHSFSFGHYFDPSAMGFGPLRVINDDRVAGGGGFPPHPHADMEIVSYVLEGALQHRDSLGTGSVIRPGDVQRMSAGTGIRHSEFNASATDPVHFLQIWILPEADGFAPSYEQKSFNDELTNRLRLVASRDGRDGALALHRDVDLYAGRLTAGTEVDHSFAPGRLGWLQVARGSVKINGQDLGEGDGAAIERLPDLSISAQSDAEILLFDMAR